MRATVRWLPVTLVLALAVPVGASDIPPYRSTPKLELAAQIPGSGGTDLEFFSKELRTWKTLDGFMITVPDDQPPVTRHFAMAGNQSGANASGPMTGGIKIVDITNPEIPYIAGSVKNCNVGQGDIQIAPGANVAAIAWQTSGGSNSCRTYDGRTLTRGSMMVDISDPYLPRVVGSAPESAGAHNHTIHPGGRYLYISTSGNNSGQIPIFDISDPSKPVKVKTFTPPTGDSPHDIRFSQDGTRAYMAGIDQFRIVDTTDPANPTMISTFTAPRSTIGHDALVTPDKAFLFVGDEENGGGTANCPGGAVYVYDIRGANETAPVLLGMVWAGTGPVTGRNNDEAYVGARGGCTSHVMDMNPGNRSFTIGWYVSGTRIFDFSGLYDANGNPAPSTAFAWGAYSTGPVKETEWIVPQGASTWAAKQYHRVPGYIFSNDLVHGFYVTKIKP